MTERIIIIIIIIIIFIIVMMMMMTMTIERNHIRDSPGGEAVGRLEGREFPSVLQHPLWWE